MAAWDPAVGASERVLQSLPGLRTAADQSAVTAETEHRDRPPPREPWLMAQSWVNLLFAHWALEPAALRGVVPQPLTLDTREGRAWLTITPFRVVSQRLRGMPPLPGLASFPEVNLRTYVTYDGRPGIYFLSLDAGKALAVRAARLIFRLPYFVAGMSATEVGPATRFESRRGGTAAFRATYAPLDEQAAPVRGSLEHWLVERYRLFTLDRQGDVLVGEIHHPPWPLRAAEATIFENTLAAPVGLAPQGEPLLQFAARQDVVFWRPVRVDACARSR